MKQIAFFLTIMSIANAQESSDLKVEADQVTCEQESGACYATGNVIVTSTDGNKQRTLHAQKVTLTLVEGSKIKTIRAEGNVHFMGEGLEATSSSAEYHYQDNVITAQGNVIVKEKENILKGDRGKINLLTKTYELFQSKENRVQGTIRLKNN